MLRLSVPNTRAAIEPTRLTVLAFVAPYALDADVVYRLELVLEEALMNREMHAFAEDGAHVTTLGVAVAPDAVVLSFEDDGIAFDPTGFAQPASDAATAIGGRGLMLTRKAASAVEYCRVGDRNRVTIRVAR